MLNEDTLLGKIVTFAILGLLGFMALSSYKLSVDQAIIATELKGVKELIVTMQTSYVTKAESDTRFNILESELNRLRDRMRDYETEDQQ